MNNSHKAEYLRAWRKKNPDAVRIHQANQYIRNSDHLKKKSAEWKAANPNKVRDTNAARRARKSSVTVEQVRISILIERDGNICGICGLEITEGSIHVDHIIPLSKGGEHSYGNTQITHARCNLKKGASTHP